MKLPRLLLTACAAALLPLPTTLAQAEGAKKEASALEERMDEINASWRRLRRQVADPAQNAASLELVAAIRKAARGTEDMTPTKLAEIPEAEQAKFLADYRAGMKKFFELLDGLETALQAGNNEGASKSLADIANLQKESHKAFKKADSDKK
jgi:soluble cytochrome b562